MAFQCIPTGRPSWPIRGRAAQDSTPPPSGRTGALSSAPNQLPFCGRALSLLCKSGRGIKRSDGEGSVSYPPLAHFVATTLRCRSRRTGRETDSKQVPRESRVADSTEGQLSSGVRASPT